MSVGKEITAHAVNTTVASTASKVAIGGSGVALVGVFTLSEWAMIVGMLVGLAGLFVQLMAHMHLARVRQKDERRKDELHRARLRALDRGVDLEDLPPSHDD